jgi:pimeloyl-ACP methyl ester carboxylesterase
MRYRGSTPPFRTPAGEVLPGSIAEIGYQRLGGLDQWVMIRGESLANPPLILLYGGPGLSEMRLFRHFNAPLEKKFTVVYWDQRGSGKSFDRKVPRSSMTVERFIADLDELVEAVCKRLGKNKVVIFGHSWGSALGVLYSSRFQKKGRGLCGQRADWRLAGGRVVIVRFRACPGAASPQPQGPGRTSRDRATAVQRRKRV